MLWAKKKIHWTILPPWPLACWLVNRWRIPRLTGRIPQVKNGKKYCTQKLLPRSRSTIKLICKHGPCAPPHWRNSRQRKSRGRSTLRGKFDPWRNCSPQVRGCLWPSNAWVLRRTTRGLKKLANCCKSCWFRINSPARSIQISPPTLRVDGRSSPMGHREPRLNHRGQH